MPTFRFEAMDSTGEDQAGHIPAASPDEAMQVLRGRGLFVVALDEVTESSDEAGAAGSSATASDSVAPKSNGANTGRGSLGWRGGLIVTAVGLVCAAVGLCGVLDSALFSIRAERADAIVVDLDQTGEVPIDILEFAALGRQYRTGPRGTFGVTWELSRPLGSTVPVLYAPDHPEDARLAAFVPRFSIPLILLVLGLMFTSAGVLVLRYGRRIA